MNIFHFVSQIESIIRYWPWWGPGVIGISIVLLPVIVFVPLNRFQKLYDFIVHAFFTAACFGFVSLYVAYALVRFDRFLGGLAIGATFLEAFVFAGYMLFSWLVLLSDSLQAKRNREHTERMQRLIMQGQSEFND